MTGGSRRWAEIDAMADKLYREAEGLPGLELLRTQKAAYAIRAEVDGAMLVVGIQEPTRLNVRISNATPAFALTIVDAIKAYARLNGLLVCPTCGHRQHAPTSCENLSFDGGMCGCKAGIAEFDVIEGGGR